MMWQLPTPVPTLEVGEVHLWQARCLPAPARMDMYADLLTPGELARAARFATDILRHRYVQAHALLHRLLRVYLPGEASKYELAQSAHGKPYLAAPALHPPLHFNLSHTGNVVCIALARGVEVGVDVEAVRPLIDLAGMIDKVCSAREQAHLATLPAEAQLTLFYQLWTRKEAWLKLRGVGLSAEPASVEVYPHAQGVTLLDVRLAERVTWGDDSHYVAALALPDSERAPVVTYYVAQAQLL